MAELVKAVRTVTIGAVFIVALIYGGWVAIMVEGIIALVYLIGQMVERGE